ncbi:MAG: TetR/AcrR family transcriptional regulator [Pseudomonadota bacterium]
MQREGVGNILVDGLRRASEGTGKGVEAHFVHCAGVEPLFPAFAKDRHPGRDHAMKEGKCSRREREKIRQRKEMLAVALDLFSQHGYHNVTMHQIAEKAEFAIGTLYKSFRNKEDLHKALVLEMGDRFEKIITQAIEEPEDEVEKLRNYIRTMVGTFRENLPFIRIFLAEHRGASFNLQAGLDDEVRKRHYALMERLASVFESGIKNKRFKRIATPFQLAVALDSVVGAFFILWLDAPGRHSFPEDADAILDIFFIGLTS